MSLKESRKDSNPHPTAPVDASDVQSERGEDGALKLYAGEKQMVLELRFLYGH